MKLTKDQAARADEIAAELRKRWDQLALSVADYQGAASVAWERVEKAQALYSEKLDEARDLAVEIASDADSVICEKSETWQESEKGRAAIAWMEEWAGLEFEEDELSAPDELELPDVDHAEALENAPRESEL